MFKKSKRNFRARKKDSDDEDQSQDVDNGDKKMESKSNNGSSNRTSKSKRKDDKKEEKISKSASAASILSFQDEEDGDVFQIKKSSHSKRVAKQLKKELKKEKEQEQQSDVKEKEPVKNHYSQQKLQELKQEQDLQNATIDKEASDEELDMAQFCSGGAIPDAATIHMIRKRRQQARETGDYVPVDDTVRFEKGKSRLVRDDDNDRSDDNDEEPLQFSANNHEKQLRDMQNTILAANEDERSDGSDPEWEVQQIKKGMNLPSQQAEESVEPEFYRRFVYSSNGNHSNSPHVYDMEVDMPANNITPPSGENAQVTLDDIRKRMQDRLAELRITHRVHVSERDDLLTRAETCEQEIERYSGGPGEAGKQYRFFQQMKAYCSDLTECLNEKVYSIDYYESRMDKILTKRSRKFCDRRQQDIRDEAQDCMKTTAASDNTGLDHDRQRRKAEREARRMRRRRKREVMGTNKQHEEGMSTDDEENPSETSAFNKERDMIQRDCQVLMEDVMTDFSDFDNIKERFEEWRNEYRDSYEEAYISLCLPKLFNPLIRLKLVTWNPIEGGLDFEEMGWFESLMFFGYKEGQNADSPSAENRLMPSIIEKVLLPKLTGYIENVFDPLSTKQTVNTIKLIRRLVDEYPTVSAKSKQTKDLISAITARIRKTLDDDVFMPLYPKPLLDSKAAAAQFASRQFWTCVKLLGNITKWNGILSSKMTQELALHGLLNRYILLALQTSNVSEESLVKCQTIISTFPKDWFSELHSDNTIPQLEPLCRFLITAADLLIKTSDGREKIKQINKILVNIHALEHCLTLASKYSVRV